jgi:O-antigen/teichoic acid export membrane protein
MTRGTSLARNVLSNWVVLAANVAFAFVITPVIVRRLDAELYGVWTFLNGLVAYTDLLYFGLGSAVIKFVAQFRATGDRAGINRLASVVTSIYGTLGLVTLAVLTGVSTLVPYAFAEPLSPAAADAAVITCVLLGARLLMVFLGSAFTGVVIGHDRFDMVNGVHLGAVVVRFIATPIVLAQAYNPLLALAWLMTAISAAEVASLAAVAFWQVPGLRVRPTLPRWAELRWLYGFGLQSFFVLLAVKLISYTDTTVIGILLGASSVAIYVLPLQLVEYSRLLVGGFAGVFLPRVTLLATQGDHTGLRDAYLRSARFSCFLSGWLGGLLLALGPSFLAWWIGPEFGAPVRWVLVALTIAGFAQVLSSQVPLAFYQGLHYLSFPAAIMMVEAAMNLAMSLWLAPRMGIDGVALATVVPALFSAVVLPSYLCRKIGVPVATLLSKSIAPGLLVMAATVLVQLVIGIDRVSQPLLILAVRAGITVPLAAAIMMMTFPASERRALLQFLRLGSRAPGPNPQP